MKKQIAIALAAAALMWAADEKKSITGTITDSMCGADHTAMKIKPDEKCIKECLKMGFKYALWDGRTVWALSDQKTPAKFAAKKVTVTGTVDESKQTIQVDSMVAAK
ncbi:MAG: hypothetical protein LAP87_08395 [Acidobacteriia bacterium]|nr:hypothetical protein [Terriglobia bacterium]